MENVNFEGALVGLDWPVRRVMEHINQDGEGIAVVVDADRHLLATVTDGDIRRAILGGLDLDLPVADLLKQRPSSPGQGPVTAPQGTEPGELLRLMTSMSIRHIPLIDSLGHVVDIVVLTELLAEHELPMTAVIMAGGLGTRLRPLTEDLPKPMLPVGDRPLMEITIEQLRQAGIRRINLTTHYKAEVISQHFGDGHEFGVEINYVEEDQPLGTAGALSLVKESDGPLLVINGDILTRVDFRALLDFHRDQGADMTVGIRHHEFQIPFGVVETDGVAITSIAEKPLTRHFINAGIYLLNPDLRQNIPTDRPYDMPELIAQLLADGRRVVGFPIGEYWLDVGEHAAYNEAQVDVKTQGFSQK
jgi:dTDP-glucose pyrophosphorylase